MFLKYTKKLYPGEKTKECEKLMTISAHEGELGFCMHEKFTSKKNTSIQTYHLTREEALEVKRYLNAHFPE